MRHSKSFDIRGREILFHVGADGQGIYLDIGLWYAHDIYLSHRAYLTDEYDIDGDGIAESRQLLINLNEEFASDVLDMLILTFENEHCSEDQ